MTDTLGIKQVFIWLAIIVGLAFGVSYFFRGGAYHFDDSHSVESNMAVRSMANIPEFWTDSRTSSFIPENRVYRPLVYTFYSVCWWLGGGKTWPFHVMKMIMHALVCLALFLIWRRLWKEPGWYPVKNLTIKFPFISHVFTITSEWAAFFLAMTFAVHPATSECVDYISATTSLQCAMFYVWAYYAYLVWRDNPTGKGLLSALLLYFFSVASKEEGITLPAMVVVTELFLYGNGMKKAPPFKDKVAAALKTSLPFWGAFAVLAAWILYMRPAEGYESHGWETPYTYFITQWRAYLWYMRLWFWPWDLNADVAAMQFSKEWYEPLALQALIGNLMILAFSWFNRKRFPAMLFGMLWFYITISPASSVVVLAEAINEHRMYLAYIGFIGGTFTVLLYCAENFFATETRAWKVGTIYAMMLIGLFVGTQERNRVWATSENLWVDTVEKNPTSGRAMNNLALVYMARAEYEKAIEYLSKCEQHWTTYMYCPLNKGIAYAAMGNHAQGQQKAEDAKKNFDLAEQSYLRAYSLNPKSVHTNFQVGKFFEDTKKDLNRAMEFYQIAINLTGQRFPEADLRMANALWNLNRKPEAMASIDRAIAVEPMNEGALFQKGRLAFEMGQVDASIDAYERLLSLNAGHVQGWYNLGVVLISKPDWARARAAFEKTVQLDPKSEQGWYNLAFTAERMGEGKAAVKAAQELVNLNPSNASFQNRLRELQKKFGNSST